MIDGSTATVPITAELIRQFNGIEDKQLPFSATDAFFIFQGKGKDSSHPTDQMALII